MCSNPALYEATGEWAAQGLSDPEEVRYEKLWTAAQSHETPAHVAKCEYCSELLDSMRKAQDVLEAGHGSVTVAACPDAATLARYHYGELRGDVAEAVREHLRVCPECRDDVAFLARSQEPRGKVVSMRRRLTFAAIAAAALIASIVVKRPAPKQEALGFTPSSQYAALAQVPLAIDSAEMMRDSPAEHHSRLEQVLAAYDRGDFPAAEKYGRIMTDVVEDPSAKYVLAMAEYRQGKVNEALITMRASERMAPQKPYRCWATLQLALLLGDRQTIRREAQHAAADPAHEERCRMLLRQL